MATKAEEKVKGCFASAGEDELLFVLRAKDALAPKTVRYWAAMAEAEGVRPDKVAEARSLATRMEKWAAANGGTKLPD